MTHLLDGPGVAGVAGADHCILPSSTSSRAASYSSSCESTSSLSASDESLASFSESSLAGALGENLLVEGVGAGAKYLAASPDATLVRLRFGEGGAELPESLSSSCITAGRGDLLRVAARAFDLVFAGVSDGALVGGTSTVVGLDAAIAAAAARLAAKADILLVSRPNRGWNRISTFIVFNILQLEYLGHRGGSKLSSESTSETIT